MAWCAKNALLVYGALSIKTWRAFYRTLLVRAV